MDETMRVYLRVSDDSRGTSGSIEQQLGELNDDADGHGWTLGDPYADSGISASRYGVKPRGDFAKLVGDLGSGEFAAAILAVWELSRFSRQMEEWLPAVNAMAAANIKVWASANQRLYDPKQPDDRNDLLTGALKAEYESAITSKRILRDVRAGARAGRGHGWVPWGYRRVYDPVTRKLVRQEVVEAEAQVVRTLYRRLLAGDSLRQISRDFEGEGVRSRTGRVVSAQVLRDWAVSPTYTALRRHQPKGATTAALYPGKWPAIVERPTWEAVQRLLTSPERRTRRDGLGKSLLSFIARCGPCGGPMATSYREGQGGAHLRCHTRSCVQINRGLLDQVVTERVLAFLGQRELIEFADSQRSNDPELRRVKDELADVERQLRELAAGVADRSISVTLAAAAEPPLLADQDRLKRRERELLVPPEVLDLTERRKQIVANWEHMSVAARRGVVRVLMRPELLGALHVGRVKTNRWCSDGHPAAPNCAHRVADRLEWRKLVAPLPPVLFAE